MEKEVKETATKNSEWNIQKKPGLLIVLMNNSQMKTVALQECKKSRASKNNFYHLSSPLQLAFCSF